MSKFHWSEDTIMYFVQLSKEINMQEFSYKVMDFIERDCTTEDDERFQDLYDDLMDVILKEITKVLEARTHKYKNNTNLL